MELVRDHNMDTISYNSTYWNLSVFNYLLSLCSLYFSLFLSVFLIIYAEHRYFSLPVPFFSISIFIHLFSPTHPYIFVERHYYIIYSFYNFLCNEWGCNVFLVHYIYYYKVDFLFIFPKLQTFVNMLWRSPFPFLTVY